ncbi:MAG: hypothetical protein QOI66_4049 [Myxococcales bacterium]|nr:hypothetical protein [Myxococcales bacterium]
MLDRNRGAWPDPSLRRPMPSPRDSPASNRLLSCPSNDRGINLRREAPAGSTPVWTASNCRMLNACLRRLHIFHFLRKLSAAFDLHQLPKEGQRFIVRAEQRLPARTAGGRCRAFRYLPARGMGGEFRFGRPRWGVRCESSGRRVHFRFEGPVPKAAVARERRTMRSRNVDETSAKREVFDIAKGSAPRLLTRDSLV